jgi:DNA recombination protein RmuC
MNFQDLMMPPIVADIILIVLLLLVVWIVIRTSAQAKDKENIIRLETKLDEYARRISSLDEKFNDLKLEQQDAISQLRERLVASFSELREELRQILADHNTKFEQRQNEAIKSLLESLQSGMTNIQKQVGEYLTRNSDEIGKKMVGLTEKTDQRLKEISGQVEKRLADGFEKTNATFADVLKRLALIDEAQKKITELSTNVVGLQEILADKSSRGAFGEVQLHSLVRNVLVEADYQLQYTLPNDKIADCVLFLPEPTGMLAIDSKFPLEAYRRMTDIDASEIERKAAEKQFKRDIQKHIKDISSKYILPGTTSDGAVMFIPAEAVFAEIQAHHSDLVDKAHAARVWMVSPTTLWAIVNTARAVIKDAATREQVHIIQEHLRYLAEDFDRFQNRMDKLAVHIKQAHDDVDNVNKSAKKISSRFEKIERVELENEKPDVVPIIAVDDQGEIT